MRPFTLQSRKMPFLVMARRRGRRCSVTHAQPRFVGTLTAFPLHLNNTFTHYAPPPGVCPHASRPGSRLMLSPFPSCCPWWCKAGGARPSVRAEPSRASRPAEQCAAPTPRLLSQGHICSLFHHMNTPRAQVERPCTWAGLSVGTIGRWVMSERGHRLVAVDTPVLAGPHLRGTVRAAGSLGASCPACYMSS